MGTGLICRVVGLAAARGTVTSAPENLVIGLCPGCGRRRGCICRISTIAPRQGKQMTLERGPLLPSSGLATPTRPVTMAPLDLLAVQAMDIGVRCSKVRRLEAPRGELMETMVIGKFEGAGSRLGRGKTTSGRPMQFEGPRVGLGRAAGIRGLVTKRSCWPGTGTSVNPCRTTPNGSTTRGARRNRRAAHLRQRNEWPLFAAVSRTAPRLVAPKISTLARSAADANILDYIASVEELSALVSIRPKRVLRCEKPSRQGQLKTVKFTLYTCMGEFEMMQQFAEAAARWTTAAAAPHLELARQWAAIA